MLTHTCTRTCSNWKDVMPYEKTTKLDYLVCFEKHVRPISSLSHKYTYVHACVCVRMSACV